MKHIFLLAVLALVMPSAVFGSSNIDAVTYSGGKLNGSNNGLTLSGSILVTVDELNGGGLLAGSDMGSLSFQTGALVSGSLQMGGTFAAGGSFTATGNGENGVPNGILFTGTFSTPVTWTMVTLANGTHNYTLTGTLSVTMGSSFQPVAVAVKLTVNTGKGFFNGSSKISGGETNIIIPEPRTLGLLGTGLIGLAGLLRRKVKA